MKLGGHYTFQAPIDVVWQALFDPEVLAKTLPGCEKLEKQGDTFLGEINVKMGPVQGKFQGKVDISDVVPLESYRMVIDGRGPAGFVKATAKLSVRTPEAATTELEYDSDVQVGGRIASVGQRLLDASSRAIAKQSLEGLHEQIQAIAARSSGAAPAGEETSGAEGGEAAPEDGERGAPVTASTAAVASAPAAPAAPVGMSQAAFAMGVAKEVTKELLPARTVLVVVAVLALGVAAYVLSRGG